MSTDGIVSKYSGGSSFGSGITPLSPERGPSKSEAAGSIPASPTNDSAEGFTGRARLREQGSSLAAAHKSVEYPPNALPTLVERVLDFLDKVAQPISDSHLWKYSKPIMQCEHEIFRSDNDSEVCGRTGRFRCEGECERDLCVAHSYEQDGKFYCSACLPE